MASGPYPGGEGALMRAQQTATAHGAPTFGPEGSRGVGMATSAPTPIR